MRQRGRLLLTIGLLAALLGVAVPGAVARAPTSAEGAGDVAARACDDGSAWYRFRQVRHAILRTGVESNNVPPRTLIDYEKTKEARAHFTASTSVEAEAGVVFAKAKTSAGIEVGKEWATTEKWAYHFRNPMRQSAHIALFKESFSFRVTKKRSGVDCDPVVIYRGWAKAPRRGYAESQLTWRWVPRGRLYPRSLSARYVAGPA